MLFVPKTDWVVLVAAATISEELGRLFGRRVATVQEQWLTNRTVDKCFTAMKVLRCAVSCVLE